MRTPHPRVGCTINSGRGKNPGAPDGVVLPLKTTVPPGDSKPLVTASGDRLMGLTRGFPGSENPSVPSRKAPWSEPPVARWQGITGRGFPLAEAGGGETPSSVPQDAGPEVGHMWRKPPVRGDTVPGMSPIWVVTRHLTTP